MKIKKFKTYIKCDIIRLGESMEETLKTYITYLKKKNENSNYYPTVEENTAIYAMSNDPIYAKVYSDLINEMDYDKQIKLVSNFINEQELKNKSEKELASKIFGVDVSEVKSERLSDGTEIFVFYDDKLGRNRIIENLGKDSLIKQLTDVQNSKEKFQTDDYKKNSNEILDERARENNNRQELKIVEIDDYINQPENYGTINEDTNKIINKIVKDKDSVGIKYINIDKMILLDDNNNVLEMTIDENGEVKISKPIEWNKSVNEVDNKEKVEENLAIIPQKLEVEKNEIEPTDNEKEENFLPEEELKNEIKVKNIVLKEHDIKVIKSNIVSYYNDPMKLEDIEDENEKEFYSNMVEIYSERKAKYEQKKNNSLNLTLSNPNVGFVNLIFASIILIALAFFIILNI